MAFTQKDMERQAKEFAALKEEFSRLESEEQAQLKALGLKSSDLGTPDLANLPPELKKLADEAVNTAKRAGEARKAQRASAGSDTHAHKARRGAVRI